MLNKKAIGIEWYALIIAFVVGIGIIIYSVVSVQIPKVGEYSLSMSKTFESKAIIPTVIDSFMELINKRSIKALDENKIFGLKTFCEDSYTGHIGDTQKLEGTDDDEKFGGLKDKDTKCIIDEPELRNHFSSIFNYEYNNFNPKKFSDFDLSNVNYRVSVQKENDAYLIKGETNDMVSTPITVEESFGKEKKIGDFYLNGNFKILTEYEFDDPEKVRCVLSKDCGATCDDVIARYSDIEFRKKSQGCEEYFFCTDAFPDDFGKEYPCEANFCQKTGESFSCSNSADDTVCPDCCCTPWETGCGIGGCGTEEMGYVRECKIDGCDLEIDCEADCNCEPPCFCDKICCGVYGNACGPCGLDECPPPPEAEGGEGGEGWAWSVAGGWSYGGVSVPEGPTTTPGVAYDPATDPALGGLGVDVDDSSGGESDTGSDGGGYY